MGDDPATSLVDRWGGRISCMHGLYDGEFVGFKIASSEQLNTALREAVVVIDANVLLDLYRYRSQTSQDLIKTLKGLGDRLVVPHQALREFWRRRLRSQDSPSRATKTATDALAKSGRSIREALTAWAKAVGVNDDELSDLNYHVDDFLETIEGKLQDVLQDADAEPGRDPILEQLEELLAGRVTPPLDQEEWDECIAEANRRIEAEEPPGYLDANKQETNLPEGGAGDYLVWYQATRYAKEKDRDLLIVTRDQKEDWWWRRQADFIGPRHELTLGFHEFTGRRLFLMRPADLLARAPVLEVEVDKASSTDAGRVAEGMFTAGRIELAESGIPIRKDHLHEQPFATPPDEIPLANPNTTTPAFRSRRDAEITIGIYKRVPALCQENSEENPWGLSFLRMFNMADDADLFQTNNEGDVLPLYEAKFVHHFDHRYGTYEGQTQAEANMGAVSRPSHEQQDDPSFVVRPRYWINRAEVDARLTGRGRDKGWLIGWRNIARSSDQRTMICSAIPRAGVGHTYFLMFTQSPRVSCLLPNLASFAFDYVVRQKMSGTSVTVSLLKQLPVFPPSTYDAELRSFIESRLLELTYTAWDMEPFARDLHDGGPPFRWDEERRFLIRAELDALYFHLYGLARNDVDYIMETFPIAKRKDIAVHGTYRTKDKILEIYDLMSKAESTHTDYQSALSPLPGHGPRHPAR